MDLNKVMIIGRLTQDPESKTIPQGATVTTFSVATNRSWKDQQGVQKDVTEFHNVVAWRKLAEICAQYLTKGKQVYIEGHLQTRNWEGQDGKKNYRTEIIADNMIMLGNKGDSSAPARAPQQAMSAAPVAATSDEEIRIEDIPF